MGFRIPHFQHFPPFASIIFLSFLIFQHLPCPPPGALPSGRAGNAGNKTPAAPVCPAPGERTISNAEVPLPRSPLSLAGGTVHRESPLAVFAANRGFSPLHEITLGAPFPPGRGSGGWGQKSKLKSGAAGNPKGKPPAGAWFAPFSSAARVQPGDARGGAPCMK